MTITDCDSPEALAFVLSEAGSKLVVIDFHATWCGPCKRIAPFVSKLSETYTDVVFVKVDVDVNSETAEKYEIESMPTFKFVKNGLLVATILGADDACIEITVRHHK